MAHDFTPVGDLKQPEPNDALICPCGGEVIRDGQFLKIERSKRPAHLHIAKENGLVTP